MYHWMRENGLIAHDQDLTLRSIGKVETLRSQKAALQYSENKNIVLLQGFGGCPFIL